MSAPKGWQLRLWLGLRPLLQPVMRRVLERRLARGKEDPARVGEKRGEATLPRPPGRLVWLHAVGLGEVLALRPLIAQMRAEAPDLHFLITSTARSSARVIGANLPPGCVHQFLPLDGPDFVARFLDHWRPALSVWSEQDLWPGVIHDTALRGIPLAWVNARMNAESHRKRARARGLYRDTLARFALISAQDEATARHLRDLGARAVQVDGSLKPAAEPLGADPAELARARAALAGRKVWVAASTHAADEAVVIQAQAALAQDDPARLMILAPRLPDRADQIAAALTAAGLRFARRSRGEFPGPDAQVWLADSFGELGLWYRLGETAFIGGSFGSLGGHNPWEAVCLGLPVLHGPDTRNFAADYAGLHEAGLARLITPGEAANALRAPATDIRTRARALVEAARARLRPLARDLLALTT
ncbi:3-deoxy-D-manno-octulosonic acid transferase [Pseudogemmobacter humi]|uniref:3-deoxy-D-manno-octulosonic acid transferase n=1 Tax=Pseudogemmobacter humi TaxID=2483812 RepID=A0A3P5XGC9_9RHOB|nr:glycosyltransferase N-terminal domain-containing protein [Pseudogemmobacter humi]VDC29211.1 3-deoxy-D-manno-octulosonic acid transferase [Pseudogemmobacter humi]